MKCQKCGFESDHHMYTCQQCSWTPAEGKFKDMNKAKQYGHSSNAVDPIDLQILSELKTIKTCAVTITWLIVIPILIYGIVAISHL